LALCFRGEGHDLNVSKHHPQHLQRVFIALFAKAQHRSINEGFALHPTPRRPRPRIARALPLLLFLVFPECFGRKKILPTQNQYQNKPPHPLNVIVNFQCSSMVLSQMKIWNATFIFVACDHIF
jgi:hypothetical protein